MRILLTLADFWLESENRLETVLHNITAGHTKVTALVYLSSRPSFITLHFQPELLLADI